MANKPNCKVGKACGFACIQKKKKCRKEPDSESPAPPRFQPGKSTIHYLVVDDGKPLQLKWTNLDLFEKSEEYPLPTHMGKTQAVMTFPDGARFWHHRQSNGKYDWVELSPLDDADELN